MLCGFASPIQLLKFVDNFVNQLNKFVIRAKTATAIFRPFRQPNQRSDKATLTSPAP
ncbi:hypothetical protein JCM12178A_15230 [Salidesulfovibrio brasiliensis]